MLKFATVVGFILIIVVSVLSRAFAASLSWNMFVPQYFGLPNLPLLLAIALSSLMVIILPTPQTTTRERNSEKALEVFAGNVFVALLLPWLAYFFVWISVTIYY